VSGYLARRTGDPGLGEELAQETFYRATRAFLGWRGGSPAAWLLAIARNVLADHARSGRPLAELPDSLSAPQAPLEETLHVRETLGRLPAAGAAAQPARAHLRRRVQPRRDRRDERHDARRHQDRRVAGAPGVPGPLRRGERR
jgi:Sigma-70 region 2